MNQANKPPVGIMPGYLWLEDRLTELEGAIERHLNTNYAIPLEWILERNSHVERLRELKERS